MSTRPLAFLLSPITVVAFTACSTSTQQAATSQPTITTAARVATSVPSTTGPAPTTVGPTTPPTTTGPSTTLGPPPTIAPELAPATTAPGPTPAGCYQATAEHEPVEVLITDNGVLVDGLPAPECMVVPESFAMTFTNNAEGDATIGFGDGGAVLAAGDSETSDPLGEMFFVGDHFLISVAELATVIDVEVAAA